MAGRSKTATVDWQIIYDIYYDPRVAPADRATEALQRGLDRSAVQVDRYFVAADLVSRYHATHLINLREVSDRVWHQVEERLLADLQVELDRPNQDALCAERDRILGQMTRPMLERAAAGWHAWEAGQALGAGQAAEPTGGLPPGQGEVAAAGTPRRPLRWRPWQLTAAAGVGVLALVAALTLAPWLRRPALAVEYVGLLPESYINRAELPHQHDFVGYRFRLQGDNLPAIGPHNLWQIIQRPPDCPTTGYGFETPDSVDLFIYCTTDMAPGQYRLGVRLPDGRKAATAFRHQPPAR